MHWLPMSDVRIRGQIRFERRQFLAGGFFIVGFVFLMPLHIMTLINILWNSDVQLL